MQKWADEILICTRAVPSAGLLVNSLFATLADNAIDGDDEQNINSSDRGILVCFVVNCETPKTNLALVGGHLVISSVDVEEGRWVWIALFPQGSMWHTTEGYRIQAVPTLWEMTTPLISGSEGTTIIQESPISIIPSYEVEGELAVAGQVEDIVEWFRCLWELLTN
ncbi:hypothetical protein SUGI_0669990 [Cryptomeria japonica]|nr:hypothetical protein SUGI_0669990 [Cryptomeria japonica]